MTSSSPGGAQGLILCAKSYEISQWAAGNNSYPWRFKGYVGRKCGQLSYGEREDGVILMASGKLASDVWLDTVPLAERVTRIDLAVTIEIAKADPELAQMCYDWIKSNHSLKPNLSYSFITNIKRGDTLYIGRRTSPLFGRLYDKGAEGGDMPMGKLWRYEIEIKKPISTPLAHSLVTEVNPSDWIKSYVYKWFEERQVPPLFNKGKNYAPLEIEATVSDDDRTIKWLTDQVKPALVKLAKKGKFNEAVDALGLPGMFDLIDKVTD